MVHRPAISTCFLLSLISAFINAREQITQSKPSSSRLRGVSAVQQDHSTVRHVDNRSRKLCQEEVLQLHDSGLPALYNSIYDNILQHEEECHTGKAHQNSRDSCTVDASNWKITSNIERKCAKLGGRFITYSMDKSINGLNDLTILNIPSCVGMTCSSDDINEWFLHEEESGTNEYYRSEGSAQRIHLHH